MARGPLAHALPTPRCRFTIKDFAAQRKTVALLEVPSAAAAAKANASAAGSTTFSLCWTNSTRAMTLHLLSCPGQLEEADGSDAIDAGCTCEAGAELGQAGAKCPQADGSGLALTVTTKPGHFYYAVSCEAGSAVLLHAIRPEGELMPGGVGTESRGPAQPFHTLPPPRPRPPLEMAQLVQAQAPLTGEEPGSKFLVAATPEGAALDEATLGALRGTEGVAGSRAGLLPAGAACRGEEGAMQGPCARLSTPRPPPGSPAGLFTSPIALAPADALTNGTSTGWLSLADGHLEVVDPAVGSVCFKCVLGG